MLLRPLLVSQRKTCVDKAEIESRLRGFLDGFFGRLHVFQTIWKPSREVS